MQRIHDATCDLWFGGFFVHLVAESSCRFVGIEKSPVQNGFKTFDGVQRKVLCITC